MRIFSGRDLPDYIHNQCKNKDLGVSEFSFMVI